MGYFSNGTAGMVYGHEWCARCVHDAEFYRTGEGSGCAVWNAHLMHCYTDNQGKKDVLDELIPRDEKGWNQKCLMFVEERTPARAEAGGEKGEI